MTSFKNQFTKLSSVHSSKNMGQVLLLHYKYDLFTKPVPKVTTLRASAGNHCRALVYRHSWTSLPCRIMRLNCTTYTTGHGSYRGRALASQAILAQAQVRFRLIAKMCERSPRLVRVAIVATVPRCHATKPTGA